MSIKTEIERISGNVSAAYAAVEGKGGTLPAEQNSGNLAAAVESISGLPAGGTAGQVLTKASDADGDVEWKDAGGGSSGGEVYSTEERRIGTWIDGKPLYQITVTGTFPKDDAGCDLITGVHRLTAESGYITDDAYGLDSPLNSENVGGIYACVYLDVEHDGTVMLSLLGDPSYNSDQIPYTVTLKYTKLTD